MKANKKVVRIAAAMVILALCEIPSAEALTVGSLASVSRQSLIVFPDGNNSVIGFTDLANGFTMSASGTTTFDIVSFPVQGAITLDGSTLCLSSNRDLSFGRSVTITANGNPTIQGRGNAICLQGDVALPACTITLAESSLILDGGNNTLTFDASTVFALGGQTLTLRNMTIKGLVGGGQFSGAGTLVLDNCRIDIGNGTTFAFDNANLTINRDVEVTGAGTLQFGGVGTLTLNAFSTLRVKTGATFDYACATRGLFVMADATSCLHMDSCTLKAQGAEGLQLAAGRVVVEGEVITDNGSNTVKSNGIQLGDGNSNTALYFKPGAQFKTLGALWYRRAP